MHDKDEGRMELNGERKLQEAALQYAIGAALRHYIVSMDVDLTAEKRMVLKGKMSVYLEVALRILDWVPPQGVHIGENQELEFDESLFEAMSKKYPLLIRVPKETCQAMTWPTSIAKNWTGGYSVRWEDGLTKNYNDFHSLYEGEQLYIGVGEATIIEETIRREAEENGYSVEQGNGMTAVIDREAQLFACLAMGRPLVE